ncbi:MAG TPA: tyrosine-type recombinase/integrase [Roseimicrobium sp.]|nr:tyrosine-type recombinase/integrase [Roseimicrobium sp.]
MWTADYHFVDKLGRRQHGRRSLRARNRRTAEIKAGELDRKLLADGLPSETTSLRTPIQAAIDAYIEAKQTDERSKKTLSKYRCELEKFRDFLYGMQITTLQGITIGLADAYKAHRRTADELQPYTLHNAMIVLKGFLKWCRKRKLIADNPLAELEIREPRRRRHAATTFEQVEAILGKACGTVFAIIMMAAFTGLRVGELIVLRPQDVDLDAGEIYVRPQEGWTAKTEAGIRTVPIHARLLAVLKMLKRRKAVCFLTSAPSAVYPLGDHHLNPREVNVVFQKLAASCGFPVGRDVERGLTFHALRRFFKTFCLDAGVPKPMVDSWMGHRDQSDMDSFYYDPVKSKEWMARVPFGEPSNTDLQRVSLPNPKGESL